MLPFNQPTSQPVSQPSFDSYMGGYATSIYAQFCMLNSHIFFFFACDFNFYDGVVRRSYYAFAPAQCNVPLFLFIVAQLVSVIVDYCVVIIRLKHIFIFFLFFMCYNGYLCLRLLAWLCVGAFYSFYFQHRLYLSFSTLRYLSASCSKVEIEFKKE